MSYPEPVDERSYEMGREVGFHAGACVVFGLIGMAYAIRERIEYKQMLEAEEAHWKTFREAAFERMRARMLRP